MYFWSYGGQFVAQSLIPPLNELSQAFDYYRSDPDFLQEVERYRRHFVWRPTPITYLSNISNHLWWAKIYLKREDMTNVWAHKINHALIQWLIAKKMGKTELIAETWAGMHGTSTAMMWAQLWLTVRVFMGAEDIARQMPNVQRMRILWAEVMSVDEWSRTLKDAVNAAMKYWISNIETSAYVLWSALWPHPYPSIVRQSQEIVGRECLTQFPAIAQKEFPDYIMACVWGGCNSIGIFAPYLQHSHVALIGVEAGWRGIGNLGDHATRFGGWWASCGIFHGYKSYFLQDDEWWIAPTHSISAGLDYPWVWPEHSHLHDTWRVHYVSATDTEVMDAVLMTARMEGILPALESAHALAHAYKLAPTLSSDQTILINLSWRWDKDMHTILEWIENTST